MTIDYRPMDAMIIDWVSGSRFSPLHSPDCQQEARRLAALHGGEDFRFIDRRIQALRKMGLIEYLNKASAPNGEVGWYFVRSKQ